MFGRIRPLGNMNLYYNHFVAIYQVDGETF